MKGDMSSTITATVQSRPNQLCHRH